MKGVTHKSIRYSTFGYAFLNVLPKIFTCLIGQSRTPFTTILTWILNWTPIADRADIDGIQTANLWCRKEQPYLCATATAILDEFVELDQSKVGIVAR